MLRIARALFAITVCLVCASAVPTARAETAAHTGVHEPTCLRSGDDRRKDDRELRKNRQREERQAQVAKVLAERRALAPVIAALDAAFTKLPADSEWRSAVLRIRDCMEHGVESLPPHLEPAEAPAQPD